MPDKLIQDWRWVLKHYRKKAVEEIMLEQQVHQAHDLTEQSKYLLIFEQQLPRKMRSITMASRKDLNGLPAARYYLKTL